MKRHLRRTFAKIIRMSTRIIYIFLLTFSESLSFETSVVATKFEVSKPLTKADTRRDFIDLLKTEPNRVSTKAYGPEVSKISPDDKPGEITPAPTVSVTTFTVDKSTNLTSLPTASTTLTTSVPEQSPTLTLTTSPVPEESPTPSSFPASISSTEPTTIPLTELTTPPNIDVNLTTLEVTPDQSAVMSSVTSQMSTSQSISTNDHVPTNISEVTSQSTLGTALTATSTPRVDPKLTTPKRSVKPSLLTVRLLSLSSHELLAEWNPYPDVSFYSIIVEGRKYSVTSNETSYRLEELSPGRRYTLSVRACAEELCGEYAVASNYTYPAVPSDIQMEEASTDSLTLMWFQDGFVDDYIVLVDGVDHQVQRVSHMEGSGEEVTGVISELETPGAEYHVTIQSCVEDLCSNPVVVVYNTAPSVPDLMMVYNRSVDSVGVRWTQSGVVSNFSFDVDDPHAVVTWNMVDDVTDSRFSDISGSPSVVMAVIRGLSLPGHNYNVSVRAWSSELSSDLISILVSTTPSVPDLMMVYNRSVDSVGVRWTQSGVVSNFSFDVDDPHAVVTWNMVDDVTDSRFSDISGSPSVVTAVIRGLSLPGHNYNVSVRAWSSELSSDLISILVSTNPSRPGPLQLINRTRNSLIISWHQLGEIDDLVVHVNKTSAKYPTWSTDRSSASALVKLTLTDLPTAGALYNISVAAVSHYMAGLPQWVLFRTVPDIPTLSCSAISNVSISVCPHPMAPLFRGEFKYSTKLIKPSLMISDTAGTILSSSLQSDVCKQSLLTGGVTSLHGWILSDLIPGATYSLTVQTSIDGVWSDKAFVNCTTHTSPPLHITFSDINETEVMVSWRKPQGHYNGFKVACVGGTWNSTRNISNIPILVSFPLAPMSGAPKTPSLGPLNFSSTSDLSASCNNLTSGALYQVVVSTLLTSASPDHTSSASPQYHVTKPNSPLVHAKSQKSNSIDLRIIYPFSSVKALCTYYLIRVSTSSATTRINCTLSGYTITGLTDNSLHYVTISAQSSYGPYTSQESKPSTVSAWTLPGSVLGLSVNVVGYKGLNISWIQPNRRTSITGYRITVSNTTGCCEEVFLLTCNYKIDLACDKCNNADSIRQVIDCGAHELSYVVQTLEPSSNYSISVASINGGGMSDSVAAFQRTASHPSYTYIAELCGALFGCFLSITLTVAVIFILIRRRKPKQAMPASKQPSTEVLGFRNPTFNVEMDELMLRPPPVPLKDFVAHVARLHKDSDYKFSAEFALLGNLSVRHSQTSAGLSVNRVKNRYSNILAYDTSRVKLITIDDDEEGSDYINASYVPGYSSRREFIATQGPLKRTVVDFWRMIWEQNIHMIVMLTDLIERNKEKCFQYWPYFNEPIRYGTLEVQTLSEKPRDDYTIRSMTILQGDKRRTVKQMQFHTWADFGCPESTSVMLNFVRKVRLQMSLQSVQNPPGPILVHCSAGVGRTGTFILIDRTLQLLATQGAIDIFGIALEMRGYRPNMIQTEAQYIFAHECIRTAMEKQLHIPGNQLANLSEDESDDNQSSHSTEDED